MISTVLKKKYNKFSLGSTIHDLASGRSVLENEMIGPARRIPNSSRKPGCSYSGRAMQGRRKRVLLDSWEKKSERLMGQISSSRFPSGFTTTRCRENLQIQVELCCRPTGLHSVFSHHYTTLIREYLPTMPPRVSLMVCFDSMPTTPDFHCRNLLCNLPNVLL